MPRRGRHGVTETATVLRLPGGRELAFAEYGKSEGRPVLAFHGTPGLRLQLATAHEAACRAGIRLVVPDRPGYGHSDYLAGRRLLDWPGDVVAIADHLDVETFGVLGVSGGGPHALACAALTPERLSGVAVVSSPSPLSSPEVRAYMPGGSGALLPVARLRPLVRLGTATLVVVMRHMPRALEAVEERYMPDSDRQLLHDHSDEVENELRHASRTAGKAAAQDISLLVRDWGFRLEEIRVPVAIWHGTADRVVPPFHARLLAEALPAGSLHLCAGRGHLLFAEEAAAILGRLAGPPGLGGCGGRQDAPSAA